LKKILFIFGTRPEAIKMAPLVKELEKHPAHFEVKVCITAQHRQMLDQVLEFFSIQPAYDLQIMKPGQTLFDITSEGLKKLEPVLEEYQPHLVLVQGDTTTAFIGALAAFYKKIKVAHVEAGLRSFDRYSPFPEEINRKMVTALADFNFVPTAAAADNLNRENIHVYITGNTVIDALLTGMEKIKDNPAIASYFSFLDSSKRTILVTGHRRESFGEAFEHICYAIKEIATTYKDVQLVYPVHLNPQVQEPVNRILKNIPDVHLIDPLDYPHLIWLMNRSFIVLTDSGGIQEEAPSLGKPVVVMRNVTERQEGIDAGTAVLAGTDKGNIIRIMKELLDDKSAYERMANAVNPYGDGTTSKQITQILKDQL
jgi:UDP-N-acetylglucosamine 2-epimerase (non-hydrolysing)